VRRVLVLALLAVMAASCGGPSRVAVALVSSERRVLATSLRLVSVDVETGDVELELEIVNRSQELVWIAWPPEDVEVERLLLNLEVDALEGADWHFAMGIHGSGRACLDGAQQGLPLPGGAATRTRFDAQFEALPPRTGTPMLFALSFVVRRLSSARVPGRADVDACRAMEASARERLVVLLPEPWVDWAQR
jgi:hypothetical protein